MEAAYLQRVNTRRTLCRQKLWQNGTSFSGIYVFKITKETRGTLVKSGKYVKLMRAYSGKRNMGKEMGARGGNGGSLEE